MLVATPSIILHAFPYGETSRIVRLATRDHGVQSGLAKGAQAAKSRFGGRLQVLSEGTAQFYLQAHRDLHTLSAFDVTHQRAELAQDLGRYAAAMAAAELVLRFAPTGPQPELYDTLAGALDHLITVPAGAVGVTALAALWQILGVMGFAPNLDACARCGADLAGSARFGVQDGGLLCARCARGGDTANLKPADARDLRAFVQGQDLPAALDARHALAHRRLLARFVRRHMSEERELTALAFWEAGT
jgi:DNA repair protein RecO (recombination protein O)